MSAPESKVFHTAVISPEALVLEAEVTAVQFPAFDGMVGILTHRAPLLTRLGTGIIRLEIDQAEPKEFLIVGGYAQMKDNVLNILTDEAIPAAQITSETRNAEAAKLEKLTANDPATTKQRDAVHARLTAMDRYLTKA